MPRSGYASAKRSMEPALRRACSATRTSAAVPFHQVCTMTSQRSRSSSAHRAAVRQLPLFALGVPGVTMQTTSRSTDMRGLYGGGDDALGEALVDARNRTLALYGHLDV